MARWVSAVVMVGASGALWVVHLGTSVDVPGPLLALSACAVLVLIGVFGLSERYARRARSDWVSVSQQLGFTFEPTGHPGILGGTWAERRVRVVSVARRFSGRVRLHALVETFVDPALPESIRLLPDDRDPAVGFPGTWELLAEPTRAMVIRMRRGGYLRALTSKGIATEYRTLRLRPERLRATLQEHADLLSAIRRDLAAAGVTQPS